MTQTKNNKWSALTDEQRVAAIRYGFKMGHDRARIAADLGVAHTTVTKWAHSHGLVAPKRAYPKPPANAKGAWVQLPEPDRVNALCELARKGLSQTAIARELGCTHSTVRDYAKKQDIALLPAKLQPPKPRATLSSADVAELRSTQPLKVDRQPVSPGPKRPPSDTPTRVHVLDARLNQCRFPLWPDRGRTPFSDMYYCGAPRENELTSYCSSCRKVVKRGEVRVADPVGLMNHMRKMRALSMKTRGRG